MTMEKFLLKIIKKIIYKIYLRTIEKIRRYLWKKDYAKESYEKKYIQSLNNLPVGNNVIMLSGYMHLKAKRSFIRLLQRYSDEHKKIQIIALDQVGHFAKYLYQSTICRIVLPRMGNNYAQKNYAIELLHEKSYIRNAVDIYCAEKGGDFEDAKLVIAKVYDYYVKAIEIINPRMVIVWNRFLPQHEVLCGICKENNICVLYAENGVLPGTWVLEPQGQMGKSKVATDYNSFKNLPITENEISKAAIVWDYLKQSGLNRYKQNNSAEINICEALKSYGLPIILFAGNYDAHAGFIPYEDEAKQYHSPFFRDSLDALEWLSELAYNNHWTLVYKPHPNNKNKSKDIPSNVLYLKEGNLNELIDQVDVVVTLTSQTSYISCIREKATVMLGYNQLRGKECAYEPSDKGEIEHTICAAIKYGMTEIQKKNFQKHIAQLNKYYLFDGGQAKDFRYGQGEYSFMDLIDEYFCESSNVRNDKHYKKYCKKIKKEKENSQMFLEEMEENNSLKFNVFKYKVKRKLLCTVMIKTKEKHYYAGLENHKRNLNGKVEVAFVGYMHKEKKHPFFDLMENVRKANHEVDFVVLDECGSLQDSMWNTGIKRYEIPKYIQGQRWAKIDEDEIKEISSNNTIIDDAVTYWKKRHQMDEAAARRLACLQYKMWDKTFEILQPKMVVLWNKFNANHMVCEYICKKRGIIVNYSEFGVLPGTYIVEEMGQMGESEPAQNYEKFKKLSVSEDDIKSAKEINAFLKESGLNRNVQLEDDTIEKMRKKVNSKQPIVLFAGNHDCDSGIVPYTEESKKFHSPFFESSFETMLFLSELAKKNEWNLIFKPHPLSIDLIDESKIPNNVIYFPTGNLNDMIDYADVTITLMSQTAYIACIREKATVMLGYNQLKGKDCVYQPDTVDEIESVIQEAIECGRTKKQQEAFYCHIAQLNKYYLFNDGTEKGFQYGKDTLDLAEYILNQLGLDIERDIRNKL